MTIPWYWNEAKEFTESHSLIPLGRKKFSQKRRILLSSATIHMRGFILFVDEIAKTRHGALDIHGQNFQQPNYSGFQSRQLKAWLYVRRRHCAGDHTLAVCKHGTAGAYKSGQWPTHRLGGFCAGRRRTGGTKGPNPFRGHAKGGCSGNICRYHQGTILAGLPTNDNHRRRNFCLCKMVSGTRCIQISGVVIVRTRNAINAVKLLRLNQQRVFMEKTGKCASHRVWFSNVMLVSTL